MKNARRRMNRILPFGQLHYAISCASAFVRLLNLSWSRGTRPAEKAFQFYLCIRVCSCLIFVVFLALFLSRSLVAFFVFAHCSRFLHSLRSNVCFLCVGCTTIITKTNLNVIGSLCLSSPFCSGTCLPFASFVVNASSFVMHLLQFLLHFIHL